MILTRKILSWWRSLKIKRCSRLNSTRKRGNYRKSTRNTSPNLRSRENFKPETTASRKSRKTRNGKN